MMFDQAIFEAIYGLARQSAILDWFGIFFAQYLPYFLGAAFVIFLVWGIGGDRRRRMYDALFVALALLLARGFFAELLRAVFVLARPPEALGIIPLISSPSSAAFPSGHATFFFVLAFSVFFFENGSCAKRKKIFLGALFIFGAALVGLGRVFVGVHWPLDIAGGAVVGFLSVYIARLLLPRFHQSS